MAKLTFSMDDATVAALLRAAERTGKSKSAVVREAIVQYESRADKLTPRERDHMLRVMDEMDKQRPTRTRAEIDAEIQDIRRSRRRWGRRTPVD
jgi:hypothetical protein